MQTFQLINIEQFLLLEQISMKYLNEVEYTIYKKFSFKTFLLYLCYCLNEQFEENLNNHLVDNNPKTLYIMENKVLKLGEIYPRCICYHQ